MFLFSSRNLENKEPTEVALEKPDSPSPKRKVKKVKSPEDSEPPKGYFEAKQKWENREREEREQDSL